MTTYINFFGGPGVGKSTAALDFTLYMKKSGFKCELVTEVAKDLVYENRHTTLSIQPYVTIKQYRNLARLNNCVDYVITDGPILMGCFYAKLHQTNLPDSYVEFVKDLHLSMKTINVLIERKFKYQTYGRLQTYEDAMAIDSEIKKLLDECSGNDGSPNYITATSDIATKLILEKYEL